MRVRQIVGEHAVDVAVEIGAGDSLLLREGDDLAGHVARLADGGEDERIVITGYYVVFDDDGESVRAHEDLQDSVVGFEICRVHRLAFSLWRAWTRMRFVLPSILFIVGSGSRSEILGFSSEMNV